MSAKRKASGIAMAIAAATIFTACQQGSQESAPAATPEAPKAEVASGKCHGINSCKGQSACATATSACSGQNACKGQGWLATTKEDCDAKGGRFEEASS